MMKHLYALSLAFTFLFGITACVDDPTVNGGLKNANIPSLTLAIDSRTAQSITATGEVLAENGSPVTDRGLCWGLDSLVTNATKVSAKDKEGKGTFTVTIENLKSDKLYYVRSYATNEMGTAYSKLHQVSTNVGKAAIISLPPDTVKATTAFVGGKVELFGEGNLEKWGIYLSFQPNPSEVDSTVQFPDPIAADSTFIFKLTKLETSTTYYYRAFYTNEFGTSLGDEQTFTTTSGKPEVSKIEKLEIRYSEADMKAEVTKENDAPVTARGFIWGTQKVLPFSPAGEMVGDTIHCGKGAGVFTGTIKNLQPSTKYYVRAFATNSFGTVYTDSVEVVTNNVKPTVETKPIATTDIANGTVKVSGKVLNEGQTSVTEAGVCWSTYPNQTLETADHTALTLADDLSFNGTISGLKGGKTYYIRAYARNSVDIAYGEDVVITTPSVFTNVASFDGKKLLIGSSASVSVGNTGYLLGGDIGASNTDELWSYNASLNVWQQLRPFKFGARKWQTLVNINNELFTFGGVDSNSTPSNDIHHYSILSNEWEQLASLNPPTPTYLSSGESIDGFIYIIGGRRDLSTPITNEVWKFSVVNASWERMVDFPESQYGGVNIVIDNVIYAGLGTNSSGISNKKLWTASSQLNNWTLVSNAYPGDNVAAGVALEDKIYVVDTNNKLWAFDVTTHTWVQKSTLTISGIHCMFVLNNEIYFGFGQTGKAFVKYAPSWDN